MRDGIPGALSVGATPREVLEIILQSTVYIGYVKAARGARLCKQVLERQGCLDEITQTQLPLEVRMPERSLAAERLTWPAAQGPEEAARGTPRKIRLEGRQYPYSHAEPSE